MVAATVVTPRVLHRIGPEDVGSKRSQHGKHDKHKDKCCDKEKCEEGGGDDEHRVRVAKTTTDEMVTIWNP